MGYRRRMQPWFQFYTALAAGAATLLGLLFVSVSMNAAMILGPSQDHARRLAEQAFQNYLTVLLVSLLALYPSTKISEFGPTTLGVTAISAILALVRFYLALTRPSESRLYAVRRHFTALLGFGLLITAAAGMTLDTGDHRSLLTTALVILLFSATTVSWELLFRIAKVKPDSTDGTG
jgi:hypothetical protein